MTPKRLTNTAFVTRLMDYSRNGAMAQLFILDAIQKHADRVAAIPLDELRRSFGDNAFISPEAWHSTAAEIAAAFAAREKGGQP